MPCSVLVIGVGNGLRGDDGAGLEVARRLEDLNGHAGIEVRSHERDGIALLDLWDRAEAVVLVDSTRSSAAPGTVARIDARSIRIPAALGGSSSHAVGVAAAIELARALGTVPPALVVYGVEGASYDLGAPLSESVAAVIGDAADAVRREALALLAGSVAAC